MEYLIGPQKIVCSRMGELMRTEAEMRSSSPTYFFDRHVFCCLLEVLVSLSHCVCLQRVSKSPDRVCNFSPVVEEAELCVAKQALHYRTKCTTLGLLQPSFATIVTFCL